jgi:hypothetical protein
VLRFPPVSGSGFALVSPNFLIRFVCVLRLSPDDPAKCASALQPFRLAFRAKVRWVSCSRTSSRRGSNAHLAHGHPFSSFADLARSIAAALPDTREAVLDGEIVCLDKDGRPRFKDLLFRRSAPCFFAFDLLRDEKDRRNDALLDRKSALRRMVGRPSDESRLQYVDHVEECGTELFRLVCDLDLEGIVAKPKHSPYEREETRSTWYKIKNRGYSQMVGRHELFERERHREPVLGWHSCELACSGA